MIIECFDTVDIINRCKESNAILTTVPVPRHSQRPVYRSTVHTACVSLVPTQIPLGLRPVTIGGSSGIQRHLAGRVGTATERTCAQSFREGGSAVRHPESRGYRD